MSMFALCPYYKSEKRISISCEDTVRQFESKEAKKKKLRAHCEKNWEECEYAKALNELYERMDRMKSQKDKDLEAMKHLADARKKENEMLRQRMGYINARNQSLEMMIGYLCDKYGVTEVDTSEMTKFFGMYTVNWGHSTKDKIVITKVKKRGN